MKSTEAICDQATKLVRNHKSWLTLFSVTQTQEAPTECLPLFSYLWSIFVGWRGLIIEAVQLISIFSLFVISNLSLFPWQLFQNQHDINRFRTQICFDRYHTFWRSLSVFYKACPNPGNLANSEASASEDTTPIPPRPTLKQKFSSSAPV